MKSDRWTAWPLGDGINSTSPKHIYRLVLELLHVVAVCRFTGSPLVKPSSAAQPKSRYRYLAGMMCVSLLL